MTFTPDQHLPTFRYNAYLVRIWQDNPTAPWRASAQCTKTGVVLRFASLEHLFAFLQSQTFTSLSDEETKPNDASEPK